MTKDERGGLLFSKWAEQEFPGIDMENDVAHAIWFATEFSVSDTGNSFRQDAPAGHPALVQHPRGHP